MSEERRLLDRMYEKWERQQKLPPLRPETVTEVHNERWQKPGSFTPTHRPPPREAFLASANPGKASEECHRCHKFFVLPYLKYGWGKGMSYPSAAKAYCRECANVLSYFGDFRRA